MDQLALGLIIALVPLVLAGLSYATFMQPRLARKAIAILIALDIIYFASVYSAEMGANQGYTKALQAVAADSVMVYNPLEEWTTAKMDSVKIYLDIKSRVSSQLYDTIVYEHQQDMAYTSSVRLYCYIALAIFIVFFLLSYLFETMKLGNKLNTKSRTIEYERFNRRL